MILSRPWRAWPAKFPNFCIVSTFTSFYNATRAERRGWTEHWFDEESELKESVGGNGGDVCDKAR